MKKLMSFIVVSGFLFAFQPKLSCESQTTVTVQDFTPETTQDDIKRLDMLTQATEQSLERQKEIKTLLVQYKEIEKACIKNPGDSQKLIELLQVAKTLNDKIQTSSLGDYFRPQLMEELKKLAKVAEKKSIPPAK